MHNSSSLEDIIVLLLAAVLVVAVFKRLNLSPVLGYLAAGSLIGPYGFAIIENVEDTKYLAEFGVVFLLFYIGLELSLERLKSMRVYVLGFGSLQLLITSFIIGYIAHSAGMSIGVCVIIGGGLALSSTAIVLQVLHERGEQSSQVGRLSLSLLIAQDLAVIPLLVLIPLLAKGDANIGASLLDAFIKAAIALILIIVFGRIFLRPVFRIIGSLRSREIFAATTLLLVLGTSFASHHFGLSLALGAFMAGIMVAETEFRHQVEADILPYKYLLLGLFFMTVGMGMDFTLFIENIAIIIVLAFTILAGKAAIIFLLCRLFKYKLSAAISAGLLLSQGSEFAFVLFSMAGRQGVMETELVEILLITVTLTMAITPLLTAIGKRIAGKVEVKDPTLLNPDEIENETNDLEGHVVVSGFGRVGRNVCKLLSMKGINYIALDNDPANVHEGRMNGYPVYYGDADNLDVLSSVGIERAAAAIVTIRGKKPAKLSVETIRTHFPTIPIIARAWNRTHVKEMEEVGATKAIAEAFEVSLQLGNQILQTVGVDEREAARVVESFRAGDYAMAQEKLSDLEKPTPDSKGA